MWLFYKQMEDALEAGGDEERGVPAISFGEVVTNFWSGDFRIRQRDVTKNRIIRSNAEANLGKWNISVPRGKENKSSRFARGIFP